MKIIRICLTLYALLWLGVRLALIIPESEESVKAQMQAKNILDLKTNSSHFHGLEVELICKVVQEGHWFFELLFISTYLITDESGRFLRVYTKKAVPEKGIELRIVGIFGQFHKGQLIRNWVGIKETERILIPRERDTLFDKNNITIETEDQNISPF